MTKFLFVGEQQSRKAARYGHTWQNQKAAGHTLAEALRANNINPEEHEYLNLFECVDPDASAVFLMGRRAAGGVVCCDGRDVGP